MQNEVGQNVHCQKAEGAWCWSLRSFSTLCITHKSVIQLGKSIGCDSERKKSYQHEVQNACGGKMQGTQLLSVICGRSLVNFSVKVNQKHKPKLHSTKQELDGRSVMVTCLWWEEHHNTSLLLWEIDSVCSDSVIHILIHCVYTSLLFPGCWLLWCSFQHKFATTVGHWSKHLFSANIALATTSDWSWMGGEYSQSWLLSMSLSSQSWAVSMQRT